MVASVLFNLGIVFFDGAPLIAGLLVALLGSVLIAGSPTISDLIADAAG